jgi:hypothetical protein
MIFADLGSGLAPNMLPGQLGSGMAPVKVTSPPVPSYPEQPREEPEPAPLPLPDGGPGFGPPPPVPVPTTTRMPPQPAAPLLPGRDTIRDIKWIVVGGVAFLALAGVIMILK